MDGVNRIYKKINLSKLAIPLAAIVILLIIIGFFALRKSQQSKTVISSSGKVVLPSPSASQTLGKSFMFSLKDGTGKEVSKFKYEIGSVEKRDEIIVKGKRAMAVDGRTFLVLNIKIKNDFNRTISINAKDYIRVTVNNTSDKFAPDINNDPVEVQPDSTKSTRLALPINDSDKNLTILVGELNGKKETITLNLR